MRRDRRLQQVEDGGLCAAYYLFLAGGIAGLAYAGFVVIDAHSYQTHEQEVLEQSRTRYVGQRETPHQAVEGEVIGEMNIPRLGMKAITAQGDSPGDASGPSTTRSGRTAA